MRFRAVLSLALATGVRGQATDWVDGIDNTIAALCESSNYAGAPSSPTVTQNVGGTSFTVTASGSPDAVYLRDVSGTTLALQSGATLDLSNIDVGKSNPDAVTAFVHYPAPNCWTLQSNQTLTWSSMINEYLSSDAASFGFAGSNSSYPSDDQLQAATPVLTTVNYAQKTATATATRQPNMRIPYLYIKGMEGVILGVSQFAEETPSAAEAVSITVTIPDWTTTLTACTFSCADYLGSPSLVDQIATSIESTPGTEGVLAITPTFQDEVITLPNSCSASTFVSYAKDSNGAVLAMATDRELSFAISRTAQTLVYRQLCNGVVSKADVSLTSLRTAFANAVANTDNNANPDTQTTPFSCTENGVTHAANDLWQNANGVPCTCANGFIDCSTAHASKTYFTGWEVAGITMASVVLFLVVAAAGYIQYMKSEARKVVEGRRKSHDGHQYCSSGAAAQPGQVEIELPTPQGTVAPA